MTRLDVTFFALCPRRESVLVGAQFNQRFWRTTRRWMWLCRVRRIITVWGETFYMRANA